MLTRRMMDPGCEEATRLARAHDARARLLAGGEPGSRLADLVHEQRDEAYRTHQLLCARCLNYATACPRCGKSAGKHALLCRERWKRRSTAAAQQQVRAEPRARERAPAHPPIQARAPTKPKAPAGSAAARRATARSAYAVLGVPEGASLESVRRAYHARAMEYHPDRVMRLAPEFRKLAEDRMREINAAYDSLQGLLQ